jgi:FolB domain-containing protein
VTDLVEIRDLRARALIGVDPHEREAPQELILHLSLFTDTRKPARSDQLHDALDYRRVAERVRNRVEHSSFRLLEAMADAVAALCLREFPIERVRVTIEKPGALPGLARCAAVTIERTPADDAR